MGRGDEPDRESDAALEGLFYHTDRVPFVHWGEFTGATTATGLVGQLCAGYKRPEPTRLADGYADERKREVDV